MRRLAPVPNAQEGRGHVRSVAGGEDSAHSVIENDALIEGCFQHKAPRVCLPNSAMLATFAGTTISGGRIARPCIQSVVWRSGEMPVGWQEMSGKATVVPRYIAGRMRRYAAEGPRGQSQATSADVIAVSDTAVFRPGGMR